MPFIIHESSKHRTCHERLPGQGLTDLTDSVLELEGPGILVSQLIRVPLSLSRSLPAVFTNAIPSVCFSLGEPPTDGISSQNLLVSGAQKNG
jgi:hypothetical protein